MDSGYRKTSRNTATKTDQPHNSSYSHSAASGNAPVRSRSIGSMNVAFAFGNDSSSLSMRRAFTGIRHALHTPSATHQINSEAAKPMAAFVVFVLDAVEARLP